VRVCTESSGEASKVLPRGYQLGALAGPGAGRSGGESAGPADRGPACCLGSSMPAASP